MNRCTRSLLERITRKLLISAGAAAALLAVAPPAFASTITYELVGVSVTISGIGTDDISGSFSAIPCLVCVQYPINPVGTLTVSGPVSLPYIYVGDYNTVEELKPSSIPPEFSAYPALYSEGDNYNYSLDLYLAAPLADQPDQIVGAELQGLYLTDTLDVTGAIEPQSSASPLPPTAALFAAGVGLLWFMAYWRKRKIGITRMLVSRALARSPIVSR